MRMHPYLFDKSSSLYRNKYLKDRAWLAVAASKRASEENCKTRWKSLRDRFVREKLASKQSSGAGRQCNLWAKILLQEKLLRILTRVAMSSHLAVKHYLSLKMRTHFKCKCMTCLI